MLPKEAGVVAGPAWAVDAAGARRDFVVNDPRVALLQVRTANHLTVLLEPLGCLVLGKEPLEFLERAVNGRAVVGVGLEEKELLFNGLQLFIGQTGKVIEILVVGVFAVIEIVRVVVAIKTSLHGLRNRVITRQRGRRDTATPEHYGEEEEEP